MPPQTKFNVGDLSLRDCWWIFKRSFIRICVVGGIYALWFLIDVVWEAGAVSTIGWNPVKAMWSGIVNIWFTIPFWIKTVTISLFALLILHEFTETIFRFLGELLKSMGEDLEKASFKKRLFLALGTALIIILLKYAWYLGFGLSFVIWTVEDVYRDLKIEKQRLIEEGEWQKKQEEVDKELNQILNEKNYEK